MGAGSLIQCGLDGDSPNRHFLLNETGREDFSSRPFDLCETRPDDARYARYYTPQMNERRRAATENIAPVTEALKTLSHLSPRCLVRAAEIRKPAPHITASVALIFAMSMSCLP